jgi:hypothetical protein
MTEASYQAGRTFMQKVNHLRGQITVAKGEVAKWTKIEMSYRQQGKITNADGALIVLKRAMGKLQEMRIKFAAMEFPDSNIKNQPKQIASCNICGETIVAGDEYCDGCKGV